MPLSARPSIARPPVPVAWKIRESRLSPRRSATRVTQGVVTPNMVRPTAGRPSAAAGPARDMPTTAWAASASTVRVMRLRPAMSATECIMVMSETPT